MARYFKSRDAAVIARRQKDLEGYTEYFAKQLDKVVGQHILELEPAWRNMKDRADKAWHEAFREYRAAKGTDKAPSLRYQHKAIKQFLNQLEADLDLLEAKLQPYYTDSISRTLEYSYYTTAFALEQSAKVTATVNLITQAHVLGVIANPWLPDRATYSERLRANMGHTTELVAKETRKMVAIAMEKGLSISEAARNLEKRIDESYYNATRLMRTELNRAAAQGASISYMQNADILDGKRWNATLDTRTAAMDAANDGKIYDLDYDTPANLAVPGQRIPNHPNCRCSYVPVLSALGVSTKERIARGEGDSKTNFGERTYTEARTYDEYAKERGLPTSKELLENDNARRYLRPGETLDDIKKDVVRVNFDNGKQITVARASWDKVDNPLPKTPKVPKTATVPTQPIRTPYTPAKTTAEATTWGKTNLDIDLVDYTGFHVDVANDVNKTVSELRARFPQIRDTKILSTSQTMNNLKYLDDIESYVERAIKMGYDEATARNWAKSAVKKKKVPGNTYAWSTNKAWGRYEGITFNKKFASNYENFRKSLQSDVKSGWHPIGTDTPASVLTHEFGHQIDNFLKEKGVRGWVQPMFDEYRNEATKLLRAGTYKTSREAYGSILSDYGAKNSAEFLAEAFSEYIHNPNPRPTAKKVGEKLIDVLSKF